MKSNSPSTDNSAVLACCMRNEGMFVVEWLAYHRLLGFQDILVFTNNCTDGSDLLLDRLQELGYVTHIRHDPPKGKAPQINAMEIAFKHPKVLAAEWLMHIDADEFVWIETGDGSIKALIDAVGEADVIALAWKMFGNEGHGWWHGGSVLTSFTRSQGRPMPRAIDHKSIFRHAKFEFATDHMPKSPKVAQVIAKNTAGREISTNSLATGNTRSRYKVPFGQVVFKNGCINHYALKTDDVFLMKNDRGDGKGKIGHKRYYLNGTFHRRFNRNEFEDRKILNRWPETEKLMLEMLNDEVVRDLNRACLSAYIDRRDKILTSDQIAAWTIRSEDRKA